MGKEWKKLVHKKPINELVLGGKVQEFRISLEKGYSALTKEADLSIDSMNDKPDKYHYKVGYRFWRNGG